MAPGPKLTNAISSWFGEL